MRNGQLKIWWIPQVPMKPFEVYVDTLQEAKKILDVLAYYDIFQFKNNIKPDYCNAGGLVTYDKETDDWTDWYDEDSGDDFDQYCEHNHIGEHDGK